MSMLKFSIYGGCKIDVIDNKKTQIKAIMRYCYTPEKWIELKYIPAFTTSTQHCFECSSQRN